MTELNLQTLISNAAPNSQFVMPGQIGLLVDLDMPWTCILCYKTDRQFTSTLHVSTVRCGTELFTSWLISSELHHNGGTAQVHSYNWTSTLTTYGYGTMYNHVRMYVLEEFIFPAANA